MISWRSLNCLLKHQEERFTQLKYHIKYLEQNFMLHQALNIISCRLSFVSGLNSYLGCYVFLGQAHGLFFFFFVLGSHLLGPFQFLLYGYTSVNWLMLWWVCLGYHPWTLGLDLSCVSRRKKAFSDVLEMC